MPISPDRILFEDQWLLIVAKLPGELTVAGKGRLDRLSLLDFLRQQFPTLLPVHRLDFETSGVLVFAKSKAVLKKILDTRFQGWMKTYVALLLGPAKQKEGTVSIPLKARSSLGVVPAETKYKVLVSSPAASLVEISFERGQRHQIRQHMAMIGWPLVLDDVYGNEKENRKFQRFLKMKRFFLHASVITFPHPMTGRPMSVTAPMPKSFEATMKKLKMVGAKWTFESLRKVG